jgi:hypothetical protein
MLNAETQPYMHEANYYYGLYMIIRGPHAILPLHIVALGRNQRTWADCGETLGIAPLALQYL